MGTSARNVVSQLPHCGEYAASTSVDAPPGNWANGTLS